MRLTVVLHKQHLHRWFTRFWYVKGKNKRVPVETNAESTLKSLGIPLTDPQEVISEFKNKYAVTPESINVTGLQDKPLPYDENHPMYHERPCFLYGENSMLVEGLPQAQNLTNTVILNKGLPDRIEKLAEESKALLPEDVDDKVKSCILSSHLFDATQEKLPKRKDPERVYFNFPRDYGVPDYRRNRLMSDALLSLSDSFSSEPHGIVIRSPKLRTILDHSGDLIRFEINPGMFMCGKNPLEPHAAANEGANLELPNIAPFRPFVSIPQDHFYEDTEVCEFPESRHVHTAVFHFNETTNTNLTEIPVNLNQIEGRTLANSYVTAAALVKKKQENPSGKLAKPLTVQGVHTNGQWFQFAVMQLNNISHQGPRNVAWLSPIMSMFTVCKYEKGKPVLLDYNPDVFRYLYAFHRNSVITK